MKNQASSARGEIKEIVWIKVTAALGNTVEHVNMNLVLRMWKHEESGSTVLQFPGGVKVSYKEPLSYFVDKMKEK